MQNNPPGNGQRDHTEENGQKKKSEVHADKIKKPNFMAYLFQKQKSGKVNLLKSGLGAVIDEYRNYKEENVQVKEKYWTYESITEGARDSFEYYVLLILSCLIATMGLIQNSPAIIIGAMIVAPLMNPIFAFSAGVLWGSADVIGKSLLTLIKGVAVVLGITTALSLVVPGIIPTPEIVARTAPTIYDVIVAICCGLVGAFAFSVRKISNALPGVAISVALMPPLSTIGIGFGLGNLEISRGAALLFLINLIGISLAAIIVFYLVRMKPHFDDTEEITRIRRRVIRQIVISGVFLVAISAPLVYFMKNHYQKTMAEKVIRTTIASGIPGQTLYSLTINHAYGTNLINAIILKSSEIDKSNLIRVESDLKTVLKQPVALSVYSIIRE